jgi:hypothetical protein
MIFKRCSRGQVWAEIMVDSSLNLWRRFSAGSTDRMRTSRNISHPNSLAFSRSQLEKRAGRAYLYDDRESSGRNAWHSLRRLLAQLARQSRPAAHGRFRIPPVSSARHSRELCAHVLGVNICARQRTADLLIVLDAALPPGIWVWSFEIAETGRDLRCAHHICSDVKKGIRSLFFARDCADSTSQRVIKCPKRCTSAVVNGLRVDVVFLFQSFCSRRAEEGALHKS